LAKKERIVTARLEHPVWGPIASLDPLWGPNLIEGIHGESTMNLKRAGIEFIEAEGLSHLVVQRGHAAGSPVWYAARIVEQIAFARRAFINNPSSGETVHTLLHLGMLLMEASVVVLHGPKFKTGVKQYQGLAKTRSSWNARQRAEARERHSLWKSKAKETWSINPNLTISRCAELVITKLADKAARKTVEDVIRPLSPKKIKVSDAG
jgi:hypothetical protein